MGAESLARAYRDYLGELQPGVPCPAPEDGRILDDPDAVRRLAEIFGVGLPEACPEWKLDLFEDARRRLRAAEPQLASLFELVVTGVFSTPGPAGSMTTGEAIGIVWISPRPSWNVSDVVEAYVHELSHTLITLDELCYRHYRDHAALSRHENFIQSAIRRERRPLGAAAHSIIVAEEVLSLREHVLGGDEGGHLHPPSRVLSDQGLEAAAAALRSPAVERLATPRLMELLRRSEIELRQLRDRLLGVEGNDARAKASAPSSKE
jgi:hypothetical protein